MNPNEFMPTPFQVGTILGASLVEGRRPDDVSENEMLLVQGAGVPPMKFVVERFVLNACAAAYATKKWLPSEAAASVSTGFSEWFESNASRAPIFQEAFVGFQRRLTAYTIAANRDAEQQLGAGSSLHVSQVSFVFGDALLEHTGKGAAGEGACRVLAMAVADAYWSAQVEGSVALFQRAKLLRTEA